MSHQNVSLRSHFPLEIVKEIHSYLDLPPLAALALVSFGCFEDVSADLYRDVVIHSVEGVLSIAAGVSRLGV